MPIKLDTSGPSMQDFHNPNKCTWCDGCGDYGIWTAVKRALVESGFTVAAMDLRGHGGSDATFTEYDDVAAGQDALALAVSLGGAPLALVGNSMGAGAAVWAAAERPDLVQHRGRGVDRPGNVAPVFTLRRHGISPSNRCPAAASQPDRRPDRHRPWREP